MHNDLIKNIKNSEGFRATPYRDTLGVLTVGFGSRFPLSREESEILLRHRLSKKIEDLVQKKPFVLTLPKDKQYVLYEMAYQLGVAGLLKFKNMFFYLERCDYKRAADEMLDSIWAVQTKKRAKKLYKIMRSSDEKKYLKPASKKIKKKLKK